MRWMTRDRQADRGRQVDREGENRVWVEKRQKRTVLGGQRVIGYGLTDRGLDLQWGRKINVNRGSKWGLGVKSLRQELSRRGKVP